jgi:hypothetical protein
MAQADLLIRLLPTWEKEEKDAAGPMVALEEAV